MQLKLMRFGAALSILALLMGVGVTQAQTTWTTSAVTGTVVSVDPPAKSVVIRTDAGSTETYLLSDPAWMRSAGRDIALTDLKVGDRVRIEPTPGAGTDEPSRTASRLEVLGAGTQSSSSPQRTVSTDRPVLGEPADAGGDRPSMPASAGSTTGRSVSTDRPVLGQSPTSSTSRSTTSTTTPSPSTTTSVPPSTSTPSTSSTYGSPSSTPPSSATSSADVDAETDREDELPATAGPLPLVGAMGLLALLAGLAVRATRKQHP
jgi:hypothetical protein